MKISRNAGIGIGIVVILAVGALFSTGMLSLIGLGEKPSCEITTPDGICSIEVTLEQGKALTTYVPILDFSPTPAEIFSDRTQIVAIDSYLGDETDKDDNSYETEEYWMYKIPSSWGEPAEILMEMSSQVSMQHNDPGNRAALWPSLGFINLNHPPDNFIVCTAAIASTGCLNPLYTIRDYVNKNNEKKISGVLSSIDASRVSADMGFSTNYEQLILNSDDAGGVLFNDELIYIGTITPNQALGITDWHSQFKMYSNIHFIGEDISGISRSYDIPTLFVSYKENIYPSNVKYGLVAGTYFDTLSGAQRVPSRLLNIADQANEFCGRNDGNIEECTFTLTFTSATLGKIILDDEEFTLELAQDSSGDDVVIIDEPPVNDTIDDVNNGDGFLDTITGNITLNYNTNPKGAGFTTGAILLALILAIIFIPFGRKGGRK